MIDALRRRPFVEQALAISVLASAALLSGAHIFQALGYPPCPLCLDQRDAHWAALGVAAAGLGASLILRARLAAAAAVGAVALVYAVSAGVAFYHAGVEWAFWPGPPSCVGAPGGLADVGALAEALDSHSAAANCADASWRLFGVSMAGYNLLASAGLFALTLAASLSAARAARRARRPAPPTAKPEG